METADYATAARLLWGEAGAYAVAEFERLNRKLFAGELPALPIVINMTPYGRCLGATRAPLRWLAHPRITLSPASFNHGGRRMVTDVLTHEMVHAVLMVRGQEPGHNDDPWCQLITELSPAVVGHAITARPVRPRRVPNPERDRDPAAPKTVVVRRPDGGAMGQAELASWPHACRPPDYYQGGEPIRVPTY
jgi:SprT-like family